MISKSGRSPVQKMKCKIQQATWQLASTRSIQAGSKHTQAIEGVLNSPSNEWRREIKKPLN